MSIVKVMNGYRKLFAILLALVAVISMVVLSPERAAAQEVTAFKQVLAKEASRDEALTKFYRENGFKTIWVGDTRRDRSRRAALIKALEKADAHGLPSNRYEVDDLVSNMKKARTNRDLAKLEVRMSKVFLRYAHDVQSGSLVPTRIDDGIKRNAPRRDSVQLLTNFSKSEPRAYINKLPPQTSQYRSLMKAKISLERQLGKGGWGQTVRGKKLEPGDSGNEVVALRNRLIAMGYLRRSASRSYDANLQKAVQAFQIDHGLNPDGVAGKGTLAEVNQPVEYRLKSVIVAMERERWTNVPRGDRHILVNLPEFTARIIDKGRETFRTRVVVGANSHDRRSPEFSDEMEHMVINPSWYVPRSIATKEYLPELMANPNAVGHLEITDASGRIVNRSAVDFTQFSASSFPFAMRQPPGRSNALGVVKFMFPNRHNIYLHDTPQKHLFSREARAYSHGCIRVAKPKEMAYALLKRQSSDPKGQFHRLLNSGQESQVDLNKNVPVHIIYRTAMANERGKIEFRRDIYGRDKRVWSALSQAGVALRAVRG